MPDVCSNRLIIITSEPVTTADQIPAMHKSSADLHYIKLMQIKQVKILKNHCSTKISSHRHHPVGVAILVVDYGTVQSADNAASSHSFCLER